MGITSSNPLFMLLGGTCSNDEEEEEEDADVRLTWLEHTNFGVSSPPYPNRHDESPQSATKAPVSSPQYMFVTNACKNN